MVFNTLSVSTAVTPTVIETYFSHYLNRKPLHQKPTAHISYHEGINLVRQFLTYASHHRVEDIQGFTSQWVPSPTWVKVEEVTIPAEAITDATNAICSQLGHKGIDKVGGQQWWQWRREGSKLKSEWIEMRRDYNKRKANGSKSTRVMLYIHGGAYFFGSVDAHRYQLQRHARKLEAKLFARKHKQSFAIGIAELSLNLARYRLSPQYPFPCGLLDCLATYLHLLTLHSPNEIVIAGDSAGAGMALSLLVILRDQNLPLPAGAILISPWVDLTHSFPSVASDGSRDYIPDHGFMARPSAAWPPPNADDMKQIAMHAVEKVVEENMPRKSSQQERKHAAEDAHQGFSIDPAPDNLHPEVNPANSTGTAGAGKRPGNTIPGPGHDLSIMIDGQMIEIKDQIQMYTTNQLISHPLVSPILQPSLGGLPPLLILTGGGEVLRDEQIYLAHKAANPAKYPPGDAYLDEYTDSRNIIGKYKATDVQLQIWDDLCHVAPTLSFTRPAKYMYRSIAQFGAWALARAQKTEIDIQDDEEMSVISSESESDESFERPKKTKMTPSDDAAVPAEVENKASERIGRAGQPLPPFKNHMIRQRVDRHGNVFPLDPPSSIPALQVPANEVGVIKPGPVTKWMKAKKEWDSKYAREKRKVQKERAKEMAAGYQTFGNDEVPPPSALAGRRRLGMGQEEKKGRSWGMSIWSLWGSSHDEQTMEREEKADRQIETTKVTEGYGAGPKPSGEDNSSRRTETSRSKSRRRTITDLGQTDYRAKENVDKNIAAPTLESRRVVGNFTDSSSKDPSDMDSTMSGIPTIFIKADNEEVADESVITATTTNRPVAGPGKAFPFKLGTHLKDDAANASTITLESHVGIVADTATKQSS